MNGELIQDIFFKTEKNKLTTTIRLAEDFDFTQYSVRQVLFPDLNAPIVGDAENPCAELLAGIQGKNVITSARATGIQWWSPSCPAMYRLTTELISPNEELAFSRVDRIAFRDIKYEGKQFFLNGLSLSRQQAMEIKTEPLTVDQSHIEQCNTDGTLIVIEIDQGLDEKSLVRAVERLRNSPSVLAWDLSSKSEFKLRNALFCSIDGTRPVIYGFNTK
ncbi:MAG: hypothetical protein J6Y69_04280 [Treponema sp.]|nr:hypothetical protein [Treponema sp.]